MCTNNTRCAALTVAWCSVPLLLLGVSCIIGFIVKFCAFDYETIYCITGGWLIILGIISSLVGVTLLIASVITFCCMTERVPVNAYEMETAIPSVYGRQHGASYDNPTVNYPRADVNFPNSRGHPARPPPIVQRQNELLSKFQRYN